MLSKADRDFLEICKSSGVDITADDIAELHRFNFICNQQAKERLAQPVIVEAYNKGIGKFLLAGVGAAIGFFVAGPQGALFGAALGFQLGSAIFRKRQKATKEESPLFEFSGVGEIGVLGEAISVVYANRSINPDGGVVFSSPLTLYSRVFSANGAQLLRRIVLLSAGKLGLVNEADLTLNQQSRSLFSTGDITTEVNLADNHSLAPGSPDRYSQAIQVSTNSFFGLDKPVSFNVIAGSVPSIFANLTNVSNPIDTSGLIKNGGTDGTFDGSAETQSLTLPGNTNSWIGVTFTVGDLQDLEVGLCETVPTFKVSILFALAGGFDVRIDGVSVATGSYAVNDVFSIRYFKGIPSNGAVFLQNDTLIHAEDSAIAATQTPYFLFATNGSGVTSTVVHENTAPSTTNGILGGYGQRFIAGGEPVEDIDTQIIYRGNSSEFAIALKTEDYIETDTALYLDGDINGLYRANLETTRPVTAVELTLRFNLFARDKDGDLIPHGMAWELYLTKDGEAEQKLGEFFVSSQKEKGTRRSIIIFNLPLAKYSVRLNPLTSSEITAPIPRLGESENLINVDSGETIDGNTVFLRYDRRGNGTVATIQQLINQQANSKIQTSNEQGPTGTLTHINELIDPIAVGKPIEIRYKNYSTAYSSVLASDRLQSAPTEGWAIDEGAVIRQYLSNGYLSNSSTAAQFDDIDGHFVDDGVSVGDRVRILEQKRNRVVTAVTQLSITCQGYSHAITTVFGSALATVTSGYGTIREGMPISGAGIPNNSYVIAKIAPDQICIGDEWDREVRATASGSITADFNRGDAPLAGAEYTVFSMGSSPYFPDQYVDRLINPVTGAGAYIDQDHFVDYASICYARRFCIENQLFHEAIVTGGTFEEWAQNAAPSSLLFVTRINGKYALIPEQDEPISGIFNAQNVFDYSEPYVPWIEQEVNTLLLKYSDRDGRDKQLKITTQSALSSGIEIPRTIELPGVKRRQQAEKVGVLALNSLRFQNRVCSFKTDVLALNLRQGQLIRTQHVITEYQTERSGRIMAAGNPVNSRVENTGAIASISSIQDGGSRIVVTTNRPHELQDGDDVVISGSTAINGTYTPTIYDPLRFAIPRTFTPSNGGTIAKRRNVFDQSVVLSGLTTIPANHRISVGSAISAQVDLVIEEESGQLFVRGLEEELTIGDLYTLGTDTQISRNWRIASLKPDIQSNTTELNCVLWLENLSDTSGMVIS